MKSFRAHSEKAIVKLEKYTKRVQFNNNTVKKQFDIDRPKSLLASNRLTKSYFSLNDTSIANNPLLKRKYKIQHGTSATKLLQNFQRHKTTSVKSFTSLKQSYNNQQKKDNLTEKQISFAIPKISLKKYASSVKPLSQRKSDAKFKLLFKQPVKRPTASEIKIGKINKKIQSLKLHNSFLQSLKPKRKIVAESPKAKSKAIPVPKQKIKTLADNIQGCINMFFNMFSYPKKVGTKLKRIQGYNQLVERILMIDQWNAREIKSSSQIEKHFWINQQPSVRPQFFCEQDNNLYNILNNFFVKMQRQIVNQKSLFAKDETQKVKNFKQNLNVQMKKFEKSAFFTPQMQKISQFIQSRKLYNQDRRENDMHGLEKLGVKFNVQQRSRELILREKQKLMKNYKK